MCTGDVDGDGINDIIVSRGPGKKNKPDVKVYRYGETIPFFEINNIYAYSDYGCNVAAGDVDGDGVDELIVAPGPGSGYGPHIKIFKYPNIIPTKTFKAWTPDVKYGCNIVASDVNGDGKDEIIVSKGPGEVNNSEVKILDYTSIPDGVVNPDITQGLLKSFTAFENDVNFGVNIACGNVDGDPEDEIVVSKGPGSCLEPNIYIGRIDFSKPRNLEAEKSETNLKIGTPPCIFAKTFTFDSPYPNIDACNWKIEKDGFCNEQDYGVLIDNENDKIIITIFFEGNGYWFEPEPGVRIWMCEFEAMYFHGGIYLSYYSGNNDSEIRIFNYNDFI